MPMYEFICSQCNAQFEELVAVDAEQAPACPSCQCQDTKRILSQVCSGGKKSDGAKPSFTPHFSPGGCGGGGGFS